MTDDGRMNDVEKIRKEKQSIKPYKFAGLQNMENNLAHDFKIDANTFLTPISCFCICR